MGGATKRRVAGVAIAGMVVAGIVGVSSMSASGQSTVPASGQVFAPYGTLTIQLNSSTSIYEAVLVRPGQAATRQVINATQPCATVDPAIGTLLSLNPTPGSTTSDTVQIRNDAFGVNTGNTSCGSSAAAVISGSELLKIELGSQLTGVFAKSASLNLTRVKSGNLTVGFDGGTQVPAGLTSPWSSQTAVINDAVITTTNDLFRSITIGSTSRKDNEGISVATGTSFELVKIDPNFDVAVACGEFVAVPKPSELNGGSAIATSARYERLDNKQPDTCTGQEVGVKVKIEGAETPGTADDAVFWNNSFTAVNTGATQSVQALFTVVWSGTSNLADLDRLIDYDGDGTAVGPLKLEWCLSYNATTRVAVRPFAPTNAEGEYPSWATSDGRVPWCLVSNTEELRGGLIVQTQTLFGSGDPRLTRPT